MDDGSPGIQAFLQQIYFDIPMRPPPPGMIKARAERIRFSTSIYWKEYNLQTRLL